MEFNVAATCNRLCHKEKLKFTPLTGQKENYLCSTWFIPLITAQRLQGIKEYARLEDGLRHCGGGNGPYGTWLPTAEGPRAVRPARP